MVDSLLVSSVLAADSLPVRVQAAFAVSHPKLIANRDELDPDVWDELYDAHCKDTDVCKSLFARRLDPQRLRVALCAKTSKVGPLTSLISNNLDGITEEMLCDAPKIPAKSIASLLETGRLSEGFSWGLALKAPPVVTLEFLFDRIDPDVADDRVLTFLGDADEWWPSRPSKLLNSNVAALIALSPGVVGYLCENVDTIPAKLVMSLCSSHQLDSSTADALLGRVKGLDGTASQYAAMALAANPRTPVAVVNRIRQAFTTNYTVVSVADGRLRRRESLHLTVAPELCRDEALLGWVVARTIPTELRPLGRPESSYGVALSPAYSSLGEYQKAAIVGMLESLPERVAARAFAHLGLDRELRASYCEPASEPYKHTRALPDLTELTMSSLNYMHPERFDDVVQVLCKHFGDDPLLWRTFLGLADSYSGAVSDVIDMVCASV